MIRTANSRKDKAAERSRESLLFGVRNLDLSPSSVPDKLGDPGPAIHFSAPQSAHYTEEIITLSCKSYCAA